MKTLGKRHRRLLPFCVSRVHIYASLWRAKEAYLGARGRLLGFLGPLCLHEGLLGTNGYGRQWDCLLLRRNRGVSGLGRGSDWSELWVDWACWVWVGGESWGLRGLGGFVCVWCGWCGGLMSLEGLKHRGWVDGDCDFLGFG